MTYFARNVADVISCRIMAQQNCLFLLVIGLLKKIDRMESDIDDIGGKNDYD